MMGLRREIKVGKDKFLIIQKAYNCLPKKLGINPKEVLNYIIVKTSDDIKYAFIDNPGEKDGFESYQGAEQFLRAYIEVNYSEGLPHRFYLNEFKNGGDGSLINKKGEKVWF